MHEAREAAWPPRQAAILAAAVKVFFQFGYRKTSMEDVAAAAEVSRQTLYLQFRHKEGLFRAALEYLTEQMLVSIRRLAGNQNGTVEQTLMGVFEVLCGDSLAVSSQINIAELLVVARSQEESICFPLRGGCAFSHCRCPDAGWHGRSMGAAWNRRAGTGDASSRHFGWRQVGDRKPV
ncbi:MAG TPA: helix-turn-helix domain-containing protein [Candidatus Acidoferrales bacterium]|nr:helix-turn-helix domain-containing protein [Candidatus Acidoferrales bacterium]